MTERQISLLDLVSNFNKGNSLRYLASQEINTPRFKIHNSADKIDEVLRPIIGQKVSVRTYIPGSRGYFHCPHLPNTDVDEFLIKTLIGFIEDGYSLILSEPIDPKDAVAKGNIEWSKNRFLIEYTEGSGTVRDTDDSGSKTLIRIDKRLEVEEKLLGHGVNILYACEKVYWGLPLIFEWSIYNKPVGLLHDPLIFWEIREVRPTR